MPVTSHMPRFGERNQSRIRSGVTLALLAVWALLALSACAQPGAASAIAGEVVHEVTTHWNYHPHSLSGPIRL